MLTVKSVLMSFQRRLDHYVLGLGVSHSIMPVSLPVDLLGIAVHLEVTNIERLVVTTKQVQTGIQ